MSELLHSVAWIIVILGALTVFGIEIEKWIKDKKKG